MPASYGDTTCFVNGLEVTVTNVQVEHEAYDMTTRVTLEGFITDEQQTRKPRRSGSGIGTDADYFLKQPIGKTWDDYKSDPIADIRASMNKMLMGGEDMERANTVGSYAYAVAQLSEGLAKGVTEKYITQEEATTEFRLRVESVRLADEKQKYEADRIEALEKELEELKAEKN